MVRVHQSQGHGQEERGGSPGTSDRCHLKQGPCPLGGAACQLTLLLAETCVGLPCSSLATIPIWNVLVMKPMCAYLAVTHLGLRCSYCLVVPAPVGYTPHPGIT